jgi:DHA1 family bicyclomycin/chloramphenicol resistance-like MFS transporter
MTPGSTSDDPPSEAKPIAPPALWLLALITVSGTLAMHIFVPALPDAGEMLGASDSHMQLTLSAYIIGLALGQLTYGPISDRFGRRPVLLGGLTVYLLASAAACAAPTVDALIAMRFLQALGACAGLVLGRAIVRDNYSGEDAVRKLSLMNLMILAGPGLSPLVGSFLVVTTGWRSIFAVLAVLGLANLVLIWRLLPETAGGQVQDAKDVLVSYGRLLKSRRFIGFAIGGGLATTSTYAFIGAAPFIFVSQLHRPAEEVGVYLTVNIIGAWIGSLTTSRLVGRAPAHRFMLVGNALSCIGGAAFLYFALAGTYSVAAVILPMLLFTYGAGMASPAALAQSLSISPEIAGSASGLYGCAQMAIGAVCTALVSFGGNPALSTGIVLFGAAVLAQLCFWAALLGGETPPQHQSELRRET